MDSEDFVSNDNNQSSECVMNYTETFTTSQVFSRVELIEWAQNLGKANGMVIVTVHSEKGGDGRKPRLSLGCERHGAYRPSKNSSTNIDKNKRRETGTKKCNCPFVLKGIPLNDDRWNVEVLCGFHNHPMLKAMEGHSYLGRLTPQENEILAELSKNLVKPRQILNTIKNRDEKNSSTMKTIYNARNKQRLGEMAGRSQMQQLMMKLAENNYVEWHTTNPETDGVRCLFYSHPLSVVLLKAFPEVVIMDCTYKTNRYNLPLLEIVGISSTGLTFVIALAYLESETEVNYIWALEKLRTLLEGCLLPRVIVTDRELALMNAVQCVFPDAAHHLCLFHINRNITGKCRKFFESKEKWEMFLYGWSMLIDSKTQGEYVELLQKFEDTFVGSPRAIAYVKDSWLNNYKDRIISAWTNKQPHFGNTTTNRAESSHNRLKRFLGASNVSFDESWKIIHSLLELQHTEIKASFEISLSTVQHKFKSILFRDLKNNISKCALELIYTQSLRAKAIGPNIDDCGGCIIRQTHGLPCPHEIAQYEIEGRPIPLSSICGHWKKLTLDPTTTEAQPILSCDFELEKLKKRFNASDEATKLHLLKKIKELADPTTTYVQEPEVKVEKRGRPAISKNKKKSVDKSTTRDLSKWEYELMDFHYESQASTKRLKIEGTPISKLEIYEEKLQTHAKKKIDNEKKEISTGKKLEKLKVHRTRNPNQANFLKFFPSSIISYVSRIEDVESDGNCGYRCIASLIGKTQEDWRDVRLALYGELQNNMMEYMDLYGDDRFHELSDCLNYFDDKPCPKDKWMTMPEMGHLIASCYNVVVVYLATYQCLTFLPLRTTPPPVPRRTIIGVGFVNDNHFVKVFMVENAPLPPVATFWEKYRDARAKGWEAPYRERIAHFKRLIGFNVATREAFVDITEDDEDDAFV